MILQLHPAAHIQELLRSVFGYSRVHWDYFRNTHLKFGEVLPKFWFSKFPCDLKKEYLQSMFDLEEHLQEFQNNLFENLVKCCQNSDFEN